MTTRPTSLLEILSPPMNPWLQELFQKENSLPCGVRVVRFNGQDGDDEDDTLLVAKLARKRKASA